MPLSSVFEGEVQFNNAGNIGDSIGSLIINYSLLDRYLNQCLTIILKLNNEQAHYLVKPKQPRQKVDLISNILKHNWKKDEWIEIKIICEAARKAIDFRNNISHGFYSETESENSLILQVFPTGKANPKEFVLTGKSVAHAAMHMVVLAREFSRLATSIETGENYIAWSQNKEDLEKSQIKAL